MCGIVGIWARSAHVDQQRLATELNDALNSLHHRGPDGRGTWFDEPGLGFGHARLSILDLSDQGRQPMSSADGRYTMVFNGEIYNFAEIKEELIARGHSFPGSGDTEVLLAAIQEWQQAAVQRFIGMFAIAYWDRQQKSLTLLRDRIGVKPLYYAWDGDTFCFCSELKALHRFSHWRPDIDRQAVGEYLQYGYIAGDRSVFRNVYKLKPGHMLTIHLDGEPSVSRYWNVLDALTEPLHGSDDELKSQLESLLDSAFRYRMVSDVPVGVFLSGGVDSSLVTAILARSGGEPIRTFTIGFSDSEFNEAEWAKRVARHCNTVHTEYILEEREALQIAKDWGTLFDEPFGDSSGIPTLLVSRLASEQVKVVLSADGGDELFNGYRVYDFVTRRHRRLQRIPTLLRRLAGGGAAALPVEGIDKMLGLAGLTAGKRGKTRLALKRIRRLMSDASIGGVFDLYSSYWMEDEVHRLLGGYDSPRRLANAFPGEPADKISLCDFHHYLPEDILTKVDRSTMAASIEGRDPLLDHRLAEFAFRLPLHLRRGALGPKHIVKDILYDLVPREIVDRPKRGFAIPLEKWLRNDMKTLVRDYLSPTRIRDSGVFNAAMVKSTIDDFYAGDSRLTTKLWYVLAFEMWREKWG